MSYEWIYGELVIDEDIDTLHTSYLVLGYKNAKLGVNRHPENYSRLIFSVSDGDALLQFMMEISWFSLPPVSSFALPAGITTPVIHAVPVKGKSVIKRL